MTKLNPDELSDLLTALVLICKHTMREVPAEQRENVADYIRNELLKTSLN